MADLGDLLGTILVSLARARHVADIETAAIAEQYRNHPLLEGLAVPRVRVPEMVIDLPVLIDAEDPGEPGQLADDDLIKKTATQELLAAAQRAGTPLPAATANRMAELLGTSLAQARRPTTAGSLPKEAVLRAVENATSNTLRATEGVTLTPQVLKQVIGDVRLRVGNMAEVKPGRPPTLRATLMTSEVKEKATPQSVVRLRLTLREEGLEWSATSKVDGTAARTLTPE